MLIAFESYVFDPQGSIVIDANPDSTLDTSTRRITRTATLDGNAVIVDNGYTASDSTLSINANLSEPEENRLLRIMHIYPEVVCSTPNGCFLGVIDDMRKSGGINRITFTIQRQLADISVL